MKKLIALVLIGAVFLPAIWSKTLVAYFSQSGTTRELAKKTAALLNADLHEIIPANPYLDEQLSMENLRSRAKLESGDPKNRPSIKNEIDVSPYDTIILAYPIWFKDAPRILYTFVEENDLSGKTVVPVCTSGSDGIGNSAKELSKAASPTAKFLKGRNFKSETTDEEIYNYFKKKLKL